VALLLAGVGLGLSGVAPGYGAILFLVVVMGLGVAAYHPEGYRAAASVAGDRRATALSWFSLGGNLGVALGPPFLTALLAWFGTAGSLGLLGPSLGATLLFLAALPVLNRAVVAGQAAARAARGVNMPRAMALLILVVTIRSWSTLGFATFVPFYYLDHLGADPREIGQFLFVFLGAGALGTVLAGPLADRWGARPFVRWVFLAAMPFGILFLHASGLVAYVLLGLFGAVLTSSFSVSLVLGQAYLPRNSGMAAGLVVGLAMGAGGLGVAFLGWMADHYGVVSALWISALMPLAGFTAARFLPVSREREPVAA
jgi:FSR family fosmidomycin resistance protein-like MFS transporter